MAQVSAPLAKAVISTYYICTFNTDYTLVSDTPHPWILILKVSPSLQVGEENVETALKVLNDRYVSKLIKKMCMKNLLNGQSPLTETNLTTSAYASTSLADTDLSSVSTNSYGKLTDSGLHSTGIYVPTALQGTS